MCEFKTQLVKIIWSYLIQNAREKERGRESCHVLNWGEHERAPHRRDKHEKICIIMYVCMYVCTYVCEFDTNFTYSDSDPLR